MTTFDSKYDVSLGEYVDSSFCTVDFVSYNDYCN